MFSHPLTSSHQAQLYVIHPLLSPGKHSFMLAPGEESSNAPARCQKLLVPLVLSIIKAALKRPAGHLSRSGLPDPLRYNSDPANWRPAPFYLKAHLYTGVPWLTVIQDQPWVAEVEHHVKGQAAALFGLWEVSGLQTLDSETEWRGMQALLEAHQAQDRQPMQPQPHPCTRLQPLSAAVGPHWLTPSLPVYTTPPPS